MSLVVLALDGLNRRWIEKNAEYCQTFHELIATGSFISVDGGCVSSPVAAWAELLCERPWYENGCAGFGHVSDCGVTEICTEEHLSSTILPYSTGTNAFVSVPLVLPRADRLWLSDGSLPLHMVANPMKALNQEPFLSYKPRVFNNIVDCLRQPNEAVKQLAEQQMIHISCAVKLAASPGWSNLIFRIFFFDLIQRLFGLADLRMLTCWESIQSVFKELDTCVSAMRKMVGCNNVHLLSTYSQDTCIARVNLNLLLSQGKYFQVEEIDPVRQRRIMASQAVAISQSTQWAEFASPMVSDEVIPAPQSTVFSQIEGGIYLNCSERFKHGCVQENEKYSLLAEVKEFLAARLHAQFEESQVMLSEPPPGVVPAVRAPDLMVQVRSVAMHNVPGPAFDRVNKPKTANAPLGFLWMPESTECKTLRLSQVLAAIRDRNNQ